MNPMAVKICPFPYDTFVQGRGAGRQPGPEPQALQDSQCLGGL